MRETVKSTMDNSGSGEKSSEKRSFRSLASIILFGMVLPQIVLVLLNIRSWGLIGEEANVGETKLALVALLSLLGMIGASITVGGLLVFKRIQLKTWLVGLSLVVHAGFLFWFVTNVDAMIPNSIQRWLLHEGDVGRWTVTLLMPGAFLSLYIFTGRLFDRMTSSMEVVVILALVFGLPVSFFLLVSFSSRIWNELLLVLEPRLSFGPHWLA